METEDLFPQWQVPASCPYPRPDWCSPYPHIQLPEDPSKCYSPISAWVSKMDFYTRFSHQNPVYVTPHTHMPHPLHSSRFYHPKSLGFLDKTLSNTICCFFHPLLPHPLVWNILLSTSNCYYLHHALSLLLGSDNYQEIYVFIALK